MRGLRCLWWVVALAALAACGTAGAKDYFFADPNAEGTPFGSVQVVMANPTGSAASYVVDGPGPPVAGTVAPSGVASVQVTDGIVAGVQPIAYRVTTDDGMIVTLAAADFGAPDEPHYTSMLVPIEASSLGKAHVVGPSAPYTEGEGIARLWVVTTGQATSVHVVLSTPIIPVAGVPGSQPGETLTVALAAGDVLSLEAASPGADFAGTIVAADQAVAVYLGSPRWDGEGKGNNYAQQGQDSWQEPVPPVTAWETEHVACSSVPARKTLGQLDAVDVLRVVAAWPGATQVTLLPSPDSGPATATLGPGDILEVKTTVDHLVVATQPVTVFQSMGGPPGDPGPWMTRYASTTRAPGVQQMVPAPSIVVPDLEGEHLVTVASADGAATFGTGYLGPWRPVGDGGCAEAKVKPGLHQATGTKVALGAMSSSTEGGAWTGGASGLAAGAYPPPMAAATVTTVTGCAGGSEVTFEAGWPGILPATFTWDFGDGTTATGAVVEHAFPPGIHTVTLTLQDVLAASTWTTTVVGDGPANCLPQLAPLGPFFVQPGATIAFCLQATDEDGDALVYSVEPKPQAALWQSPCFTWSPAATGTLELWAGATDGKGTALQPILIEVAAFPADADQDGRQDSADNCAATANLGQADADRDGRGDACQTPMQPQDPGGAAATDARLASESAASSPAATPPCAGLACTADQDADGVPDSGPAPDNCLGASNPRQEDADGDGIGDACRPPKAGQAAWVGAPAARAAPPAHDRVLLVAGGAAATFAAMAMATVVARLGRRR